jgi:hypothetical protein
MGFPTLLTFSKLLSIVCFVCVYKWTFIHYFHVKGFSPVHCHVSLKGYVIADGSPVLLIIIEFLFTSFWLISGEFNFFHMFYTHRNFSTISLYFFEVLSRIYFSITG